MQVTEASAKSLIDNTQGSDDHGSMLLLLVSLDTKIDDTNPKAHIIQLYPDLFDGLGTIKNAVVHLDVKPDASPVMCMPRRVPDVLCDSLKEELDRMEAMKVRMKFPRLPVQATQQKDFEL